MARLVNIRRKKVVCFDVPSNYDCKFAQWANRAPKLSIFTFRGVYEFMHPDLIDEFGAR
jgi:predicted protein tyrosine phosphatase